MVRLTDAVYLLIALALMPVLLYQKLFRGKSRHDWRARFGHGSSLPIPTGPRVLVHAVSVGEVNASRHLVAELLRQRPDLEVVVAATTDTGYARAVDVFGSQCPVVRYPLDYSPAVDRFLRRIRPDVIVLVELEVWPNMVRLAQREGISVIVVNGRLSARSAKWYGWFAWLVRPIFSQLACVAAQSEEYADRFRRFGVAPERAHVTGSMKWDTAEIADHVPGADALGRDLGIDRSRPLIVAGSTAPEEHRMLHEATPTGAQLLCAPRRPEWFDPAAEVLAGCARRSRGRPGSATDRFLLDSIGELRLAYALADVVVVGRTFVELGGSDMIEPVALGKATIVGPDTANFASMMDVLREHRGVIETTAASLPGVLRELLNHPDECMALAQRGREAIRAQQGASERNAAMVIEQLQHVRGA